MELTEQEKEYALSAYKKTHPSDAPLTMASPERSCFLEGFAAHKQMMLDLRNKRIELPPATLPNFDSIPFSEIEKRMDEMRQYPLTMDEVFPTTIPKAGLTADCGSVDGKNPGIFKFRIVDIASKTILEEHIIPGKTTNNVAEYLGCVWAMRHNKINNLNLPVYTDSKTARSWVKKKGCRTTLEITDKDQQFMIAAANMFLKDKPSIPAPLFWSTEEWGDIPADYGMKPPRKPKE